LIVHLGAAVVAGGLTGWLSFAPIGWWWFPYIGFAVLAALIVRSSTVKRGALIGFVFGLAYFLAGVAWVRVSMNEFGGMPLALAWFSAFLFCAFLALYPMLAAAFTAWARPKSLWLFAFVFASAWTFAEYLRAHLFTGFEWLSVGASQAGTFSLAPLFGAFGTTFATVFAATCVTGSWIATREHWQSGRENSLAQSLLSQGDPRKPGIWVAAVLMLIAAFVGHTEFSAPSGKLVKVSLLQGNVAQSMKWEPEKFVQTLQLYEKLVMQAKGELIILPETALPAPLSRVPPEYIERLRGIAHSKNANLVIGVPVQDNGKFYNAAVSIGVEDSQQYRKAHLVPFGEYMPLRGPLAWFYANLVIPMSDFASGDPLQPNIKLNGQSLGISICYEDAFARDVHRTLPDATLLVNISNDAWFGQSAAAEQHLQLSQMRAIEFARPMLRANNTGITAVVDEKGRVTQRLAPFTEGILETTIQGRKGSTPYAAWGDLPILLICLAGLGIGTGRRLRRGANAVAQ
jgi:apolipoprotein N-acyltransferase